MATETTTEPEAQERAEELARVADTPEPLRADLSGGAF